MANNLSRLRVGAAGVVAALVIAGCNSSDGERSARAPETATTAILGPRGTSRFEVESQTHTTSAVTYPQTPPVGGPHNPAWQNCGFYPTPITTEMGVHSMEHGAVWVTYRADLPAEAVAALQALANSDTHILVSAFADLPTLVVVSAWGRQLTIDDPSDERLQAFIDAFREGPQTPELGAPCVGGMGNPQ